MATQAGKGAALRSGFAAATGDIIVALDADCSMHPREIVLLVSALMSGADFVKGSRFIQGGGTADMSFVRMVGNWGLAKAVRALFGGSFSDAPKRPWLREKTRSFLKRPAAAQQ
jgi:glycosyltransferase involved in cell wall biosynthesis